MIPVELNFASISQKLNIEMNLIWKLDFLAYVENLNYLFFHSDLSTTMEEAILYGTLSRYSGILYVAVILVKKRKVFWHSSLTSKS